MSFRLLRVRLVSAGLLLGAGLGLSACGPQFKDQDMALLKKPELLSVVAAPPMAAPETAVALSFLLADQHGPITGLPNAWLPVSAGANGSLPSDPEAITREAEALGLTLDALVKPVLSLTLKSGRDYTFNTSGYSAQMVTLLAATSEMSLTPEQIAADPTLLMKEVEGQRVKLGLRTVQVALTATRNANPRITAIEAATSDGAKTPLSFSSSEMAGQEAGAVLAASRQARADAPLEVKSGTKVTFLVSAEDDGPSADLRYQWISNGGDFGGYRLKKEPWRAPRYQDPAKFSAEQKDWRGKTLVAWRQDPNLYAVWLILRDNGKTLDSLGQSWAEFFVRIVP